MKNISKAIKKVTGAVKKIVKGAGKILNKVMDSKVFKYAMIAATVYFGGAAIMGAMGGASAGTGFLGTITGAIQGAGAGLSSAMQGISGAWTAITGGQGIGAAASSLGSGVSGAYGAGQAAVSGAAAAGAGAAASGTDALLVNAGTREAGTGVITNTMGTPINAGGGMFNPSSVVNAAPQISNAPPSQAMASTGNKFEAMSYKDFVKDAPKMSGADLKEAAKVFGEDAVTKAVSAKNGLLSNPFVAYGATQMAGGLLQGYAADKQAEDERKRYNSSIGGFQYERRYS